MHVSPKSGSICLAWQVSFVCSRSHGWLYILQLKPGLKKVHFPKDDKWKKSSLFEKYSENGQFEVILIGLDGGVKLRKSELLSSEELFTVIDGMPMRRAEIRRSKNDKN